MRFRASRPAASTDLLSPHPTIPGLALRRLLQPGGTAWVAVELATGVPVVLRPARSGLAVESLPRHRHLSVPTEVTDDAGARWWSSPQTLHGGLDQLLVHRRLLPGEIVTVGMGLARALATLHAKGFVYGELRASSVLIEAGGQPLLDGAAVRGASGSAAAEAQAADVASLGALLIQAAEQPLPQRLALVLKSAGQTSAAELVSELVFATPPKTLTLAAAGSVQPRPTGHRWRIEPRWRRGLQVGVASAAAVAVAVAAGILWTDRVQPDSVKQVSSPSPKALVPSPSASVSADSATRWLDVVRQLDEVRVRAFESGDVDLLDQVDAPGSAALSRDLAATKALRSQGLLPQGQTFKVLQVQVLRTSTTRTSVEVTDEESAYELRRADGSVVIRRPARQATRWIVELTRLKAHWLIDDVRRA